MVKKLYNESDKGNNNDNNNNKEYSHGYCSGADSSRYG
jgi:hypothetical protein